MSLLPFLKVLASARPSGRGQRLYGTTRVLPQVPRGGICWKRQRGGNEKLFTLFSEAGSNIVERVAIPLAARFGSAIAAAAE